MGTDIDTNNYKKIVIPLPEGVTCKQLEEVNFISGTINKKDLHIEVIDHSIELYINQVNIQQIKDINNKLNNPIINAIIKEIESIKSYNLKGNKRVFAHYNKERKVKNRKSKEENRGKHYYTKDNSFNTKNNELPYEFADAIICEDSYKALKNLPDNCIDLVFTSPPYNFGLEYHDQQDEYYWEHYFEKLFDIFQECIRVLKYGGRVIVNIQPLFSDYIPSHHMISNFFIENKMIWKGEILWEKNNYNCKYTAWGSWKSPSSPYLKYTWEFLEIFCKGDLKKKGDKEKIDINSEEFKQWVVAKWSIAPERNMKEYEHPAMFPEELVKRVLKLFSYEDDIILDPFNGVGTTTAVAKRLNRRYIGIDISKKYCTKAENRLKSMLDLRSI